MFPSLAGDRCCRDGLFAACMSSSRRQVLPDRRVGTLYRQPDERFRASIKLTRIPMLPVSANDVIRFTPPDLAEHENAPLYLIAVPTLLRRAAWRRDVSAQGARYPGDSERFAVMLICPCASTRSNHLWDSAKRRPSRWQDGRAIVPITVTLPSCPARKRCWASHPSRAPQPRAEELIAGPWSAAELCSLLRRRADGSC